MAQNGHLFGVLHHSKHSEEPSIKCCGGLSYTGVLPSIRNGIFYKVSILGWDVNLFFRCNSPLNYFLWTTGFPKLPSDQRNQVMDFVRHVREFPKYILAQSFHDPSKSETIFA